MYKEKIISGLIGTLFFVVFQPFGLSSFGLIKWLYFAGIAVLAVSGCLISEIIIRYVFLMPIDKSAAPGYMMRRGILYQIVNTVLLTIALTFYFGRFVNSPIVDNHLSWALLFKVLASLAGASLIIGLYWRNVYWKRYYARQLEEANLLNGILIERARQTEKAAISPQGKDAGAQQQKEVFLEGTTKDSVNLILHDFLYAESKGNYVSIYCLYNGEVRCNMIRNSLKYIISMLCVESGIMQCHRAFVVNLSHVDGIEGRSSGMGIRLKGCEMTIPVSKAYVSIIKDYIRDPEHQA